jgi:hypothetical protein
VLAAGWVGPASATPALASLPTLGGHSGLCTTADPDAVSVVIDHGALGGGVQTYCATGLSARSTGSDALRAVGLSTTGTVHDGPGFVCRIQGRPSAGETVPLPNDPSYTEQCVDTPPATAYWSYWHAPSGGPWSYSQSGFMSHRVVLGGFEGWSFATGSSSGAANPPRVNPITEPAPEPPPPPPTEPEPAASNPPPGTVATAPTGSGASSGATAPGAGPATDGQTEQPAAGDPEPSPTDSGSANPTVSSSASADPTAGLGAAAGPTESSGAGGPSPTALIGLGVVVLLGGAGAAVAWSRRRRSAPLSPDPLDPSPPAGPSDAPDRPASTNRSKPSGDTRPIDDPAVTGPAAPAGEPTTTSQAAPTEDPTTTGPAAPTDR